MSRSHGFFLFRREGLGCLVFSVIQCAVFFALSLAIGAGLCLLSDDPAKLSPAVGCVCYLFSGALCGLLTAKRGIGSGLTYAVLSALVFALSLLLTGLIVSHGALPITVVLCHLAYLLSVFVGYVCGTKKSKVHAGRRMRSILP